MRTRAPAVVSLLAVASLGLTSCADLGGLDLSAVGDEGKTTYIKLALNQAETHPSYIALESIAPDHALSPVLQPGNNLLQTPRKELFSEEF